jgi:hypothetical protein
VRGGARAANFTTDSQGRRSPHLIRQPDSDSGFVRGAFSADLKVWVTAVGGGTKLVTLHATPQDTILTIPVEGITAVALQSCEFGPGTAARVLTTAN